MANNVQAITDNLDLWTSALLTKSTAGRGSNGRVEAYGIKKLRELILELAVRGKLVPQDANDEPASELLKRTVFEKRRLVKANVLRDSKAPLYPEELPDHELPSGWVWTNLYELGEISPRNDAEDSVEASFVPMQFISEKYGDPMQHEVKLWKEIKNGFTHFKEEDVVLAKITPCFQNGKSAVIRGLTNGFGSGTTELHVYRSINACTAPAFVLIYLKSPRFISDGISKMTGTAGQKRITRDYFAGNHFPLPPLSEQHRIVTKVDELMALCDQLEQQQTNSSEAHQTLVGTLLGTLTNTSVRPEPVEGRASTSSARTDLEENWARIDNHFDTLFTTEQSIDQLKQTILQLAVMGKLVPQDPNDEPASVLLGRIAQKKERLIKDGKIKNQSPLQEINNDEKPFELPPSWEWARLPEIGELARGKSKHRPRNDSKLYVNGTIPMIQTGDVAKAAPLIETYTALYNENGLSQSRLWPRGTMCITIAANIADTGVLAFDACFPDSVVGFIPFDEKLNVGYFDYFIRTAKSHLEDFAPSTAQKNINLEILGQLLVPLPPARELTRIVTKVDELMTLCDTLKARLATAQTTQIHLADAIVERAVA